MMRHLKIVEPKLTPVEELARDAILRELADIIHDATCNQNHIDGCGWEYEDWDKKIAHSRTKYLRRAETIVNLLVKNGTERDNIDIHLLADVFDVASGRGAV